MLLVENCVHNVKYSAFVPCSYSSFFHETLKSMYNFLKKHWDGLCFELVCDIFMTFMLYLFVYQVIYVLYLFSQLYVMTIIYVVDNHMIYRSLFTCHRDWSYTIYFYFSPWLILHNSIFVMMCTLADIACIYMICDSS